MYMKNCAGLIGLKLVHSHVIRVPSCNTSAKFWHEYKLQIAHALSKYLSGLSDLFSYTLLTSNNMISLAIWCNGHL